MGSKICEKCNKVLLYCECVEFKEKSDDVCRICLVAGGCNCLKIYFRRADDSVKLEYRSAHEVAERDFLKWWASVRTTHGFIMKEDALTIWMAARGVL